MGRKFLHFHVVPRPVRAWSGAGYFTSALRFKLASDGSFLSDEEGMAASPWVRLRELENAAWQIQSPDIQDDLQVENGLDFC